MKWIAPPEKDDATTTLEKRLWDAADLLLMDFHRLTQPLFKSIFYLARQINNLRRTRDLLLPRLLSGQIDVMELAA